MSKAERRHSPSSAEMLKRKVFRGQCALGDGPTSQLIKPLMTDLHSSSDNPRAMSRLNVHTTQLADHRRYLQ